MVSGVATGKTLKCPCGVLKPGCVSRFKREHWARCSLFRWAYGCGLGLAVACSVDSRPGAIAMNPGENTESADLPNRAAGGSAGAISSVTTPGDAQTVADGTHDGQPPDPLPLGVTGNAPGSGGASGNGAFAANAAAGASGSGAGMVGEAPGSGGTSGVPEGDPGETEPLGGCFQQLLPNASFERGHVAWTETADVRDVIVRADHPALAGTGVSPQSGNYLAWVGGVANGDFAMYQTTLRQEVAVPAEATSLTFSGYAWVSQPDLGEPLTDWAVLQVEDPNPASNGIWLIQRWDDQSVTQGWQHFEVVTTDATILSRLAGHTVPVTTFAVPNGSGTLSVWLDSLRQIGRAHV